VPPCHCECQVIELWGAVLGIIKPELCAAVAAPPPPTACGRRAGAVFVTCSRHLYTSYMLLAFCNAE